MTRDEIIIRIHREGAIKEVCQKIGRHLSDDLYSEVIIILLEYPNLIELYNNSNGSFNYFVVRIINTMYNSPRHPFYEKYRKKLPQQEKQINTINEKIRFEIDLEKTMRTIVRPRTMKYGTQLNAFEPSKSVDCKRRSKPTSVNKRPRRMEIPPTAPHANQRPVPRSSPMVSCFAYARTRSTNSAIDDPEVNESTYSFNQQEG